MNYDRDNPQRESLRMIPRTQMKSQQLIEIEKMRVNTRQLICFLTCGVLGCILAAFWYSDPLRWKTVSTQLFRVFFTFVMLSAFLYAGALWSEIPENRTIGYGCRAVIISTLCLGALLVGLIAMLFQALCGTSVLSQKKLVLVVDRSGSMQGENTEYATQFLDELSTYITDRNKVEFYKFPDDTGKDLAPTWNQSDKSISSLLGQANGGSDFSIALNRLTDHKNCVIILVTDCDSIDSFSGNVNYRALKVNNNRFVVIQLASNISDSLRKAADDYLEFQRGDSKEKIEKFLYESLAFSSGLLTPVPGEAVSAVHLLMLIFLGFVIRYILYLAFGRNRRMRPQLLLGIMSGAACSLILRQPLLFSSLPDEWANALQTLLSILPFCLLLSTYTVNQSQIVHNGFLTYEGTMNYKHTGGQSDE